MGIIEQLNDKIKNQDEIIYKHEQIITQLSNKIDQLIIKKDNKNTNKQFYNELHTMSIPSSIIFENPKNNYSKVEEVSEEKEEDIENVEEIEGEDEDLDAELADELKELES